MKAKIKDSTKDNFATVLSCVRYDFTVANISEMLGISVNNTYWYIRHLIDAGLIRRRKEKCPYVLTTKGEVAEKEGITWQD